MKIGFDYWHVISDHPDYFRELATALLVGGHEVHVISAIGKGRAGTIAQEVADLSIVTTAVHECIFRHPRESPAVKTAKALELGLDVFYDDRADVCQAMTATGKILAMQVTRPGRRTDTQAERV